MTLEQLATEFLQNYAERRLRPATVRGYAVNLNNHILPYIGAIDIFAINVGTLDYLNEELQLSNKSKIYVHATLRKALNYAIRREYLAQNPYRLFDLPKVEEYKYRTLPENEIHRLLQLIHGEQLLEVPVTLAICYGLRRGECLGIMPERDLDEVNGILHIQRTISREHGKITITPCKTKASNRYILLQSAHVRLLQNWRNDLGEITPSRLDRKFKDFLQKHDFTDIRFHDLRHSYATLMLSKGIHPKIVSAVLGHSKISTTLDIYSHPNTSMQQCCIDVIINTEK